LQIEETNLSGCFVIKSTIFKDSRGFFTETFHKNRLEERLGHELNFVQDNQSVSFKNVLRGLHFQKGEHAQAKLVRVIRGRALDVAVDLRVDSPSFGQVYITELSEVNNLQMYMPKGLAHGFLSLEDQTVFYYKCDAYYHQESEAGIIYNDPDLRIEWGIPEPKLILSEKDRKLPFFKQLYP
jgi:dTDP-4-dehydrorhamnose 3,5-epimerase